LLEIPSDAEKYDNIVAFWAPDQPSDEGKDYTFRYRMHFTLDETSAPLLGKVASTRIGSAGGGENGQRRRKFVVDFQGEALKRYGDKAKLTADVSVSSGKIDHTLVQKNRETGGWRLSFELAPEKDKDPVELRAALKSSNEVLTETWLYQWSAK
jgi:glucans biosynthesis protein